MRKTAAFFAFNPQSRPEGMISTGHWVTQPGYGTVRQNGTQDWLVIYTIGGSGKLSYKDGGHLTAAGHIALWFPGTYHDYRIAPGCGTWEIIWAHFMAKPHWHEFLEWPQKGNGPRLLVIDDRTIRQQVLASLKAMHAYGVGPLERGRLLALNALEKALLLADLSNPGSKQARLDPRIHRSLDMLCEEAGAPLALASVAGRVGLSLSRWAHLFSKQMGMTPVEYRETHRLTRARRLLETTTFSVKEIAAMTGFESQFYFSRRFKLRAGASPRQFREGIERIDSARTTIAR